jgi:hypothetical protein
MLPVVLGARGFALVRAQVKESFLQKPEGAVVGLTESPALLRHLVKHRLEPGRPSDGAQDTADRAVLLPHVLELTGDVPAFLRDASHFVQLKLRGIGPAWPRLSGGCVFGQAVLGDDALVVHAAQRDHILDVGLGLDPAGAEARPAREDRVVVDPAGLEEWMPGGFREAEVARAIAVQVADLTAADLERELSAPTRGRP